MAVTHRDEDRSSAEIRSQMIDEISGAEAAYTVFVSRADADTGEVEGGIGMFVADDLPRPLAAQLGKHVLQKAAEHSRKRLAMLSNPLAALLGGGGGDPSDLLDALRGGGDPDDGFSADDDSSPGFY